MFRALIVSGLLASSTALAAPNHEAAAEAIRGAAGTEGFDDAVTQALLAQYDSNGDGTLSKGGEVKAISCVVWSAIDAGVQQQWSSSARVIYGFKKGFIWVGYAFGIDEKMRKLSDKQMAGCGIAD